MSDWRGDVAMAREAARGGESKEVYVRHLFSAIAPRYDLLNHLLSFNIDRRWRRRAIGALDWTSAPAGTYLDLCAGTLDVALALASDSRFTGHIIGADFAEPMLSVGRRKVGAGRIHPVAGDALSLPLASGSIDGAIVAFGMRNVTSLGEGLREVHRVLRSGGRFVILEFSMPRSSLVRAIYLAYFNRILPVVGRIISGHRTAYTYLPASVANFPVEADLAARMRDSGFERVRWSSLSLGIAAIHVGEKA